MVTGRNIDECIHDITPDNLPLTKPCDLTHGQMLAGLLSPLGKEPWAWPSIFWSERFQSE